MIAKKTVLRVIYKQAKFTQLELQPGAVFAMCSYHLGEQMEEKQSA
jgi:hypothetical protein